MISLEATLAVLFFIPAINFFRLLRLFKSSRLVAGDTFLIFRDEQFPRIGGTLSSKRCSEMHIDYGLLHIHGGSYELLSSEVPFFDFFCENLLPVIESQKSYISVVSPSPLELALELYGEDEARSGGIRSRYKTFENRLRAG